MSILSGIKNFLEKYKIKWSKKDLGHLFLDSVKNLSLQNKNKIVEFCKGAENILPLMDEDISIFSTILPEDTYKQLVLSYEVFAPQYIAESLLNDGCNFITIDSPIYPEKLKNIYDPPHVLYYKGNIDLLKDEQMTLAIVGSRTPTKYGERITEKFARELSMYNFTVVAGLADGIDSIAHKEALKYEGKTIAVLAHGLNYVYPQKNKNLLDDIVEKGGLVITEYSHLVPVQKHQFLLRNRIIVGLSNGVLITEASPKSGTMHTKDYCLDENRDLFAVCGNIDSINSAGTNSIIKQFPESMVTNISDILNYYSIPLKNESKSQPCFQLSIQDKLIMDSLDQNEDTHFDEIIVKTKLDAKTLNNSLTTLCLRGIIVKYAGNYYRKK